MRVLLAFDKFKDAVSAEQLCAIAATTLRAGAPDWEIDPCPLTDGGEGFVRILTAAAGGSFRSSVATGPRGRATSAQWGIVPLARLAPAARARLGLPADAVGHLALVEMAMASGLSLLASGERDPWRTSSRGTGELIRAAADSAPLAIVLGVGGSATSDLGLGALHALGLQFRPALDPLHPEPVPAVWDQITGFTGSMDRDLPPIRIACDVTNPLLGPRGCVRAFAPQKGLAAGDESRLETATARLAALLAGHFRADLSRAGEPGSGAAGGIAFGLRVALDASIVAGSALVADWLGLDERIRAADLILTGEGSFDESSLEGKGAGAVVMCARRLGKPVEVFAGRVSPELSAHAGVHVITPPGMPLPDALAATPALLRAALERRFS